MRSGGGGGHLAARSAFVVLALLVGLGGCAAEDDEAAVPAASYRPAEPPDLTGPLRDPTPPEGLSEVPRENELAIRCNQGMFEWCDLVFARVPPTTPISTYVGTCGGRMPRLDFGESPNCHLRTDPSNLTPEPAPTSGDPELAELATACEDEDLDACDELWSATDPGTALEQYGATCGGRSSDRRPNTCLGLLGIPAGTTPGNLGGDAKLNRMALECFHGQLDSCDDLFVDADRESDYRPYAASCAGRLEDPPTETLPSCRRRFADPVVLTTPDPLQDTSGADELLLDLADACFDADMEACDELYVRAPDHSVLEVYGQTCGARFQDTDIDIHFVAPGACDAFVIANPGDEAISDVT
jgi:hypothetical protein